jgi:hypothetical protein
MVNRISHPTSQIPNPQSEILLAVLSPLFSVLCGLTSDLRHLKPDSMPRALRNWYQLCGDHVMMRLQMKEF